MASITELTSVTTAGYHRILIKATYGTTSGALLGGVLFGFMFYGAGCLQM
ncbi:hypothetical protein AZE42_12921 [Rhizopogon vesiculosus]|uniref:Uncharacterized protein n=1 Tax=Rhizopogon vesiculosus TaxID=180088 RepID=A0A1J8QR16_9AGAM|nr:hypothetical protein AZE42_12921 [Rhizopogon vesiculosus]